LFPSDCPDCSFGIKSLQCEACSQAGQNSTRLEPRQRSGEEVMAEVAEDIKQLGDNIVKLTLKQAVDLASYLKDTYQIEPAAGGAVMVAGPGGGGGGAAAPVEEAKSTFDVVLKSGGDKKIQV